MQQNKICVLEWCSSHNVTLNKLPINADWIKPICKHYKRYYNKSIRRNIRYYTNLIWIFFSKNAKNGHANIHHQQWESFMMQINLQRVHSSSAVAIHFRIKSRKIVLGTFHCVGKNENRFKFYVPRVELWIEYTILWRAWREIGKWTWKTGWAQ